MRFQNIKGRGKTTWLALEQWLEYRVLSKSCSVHWKTDGNRKESQLKLSCTEYNSAVIQLWVHLVETSTSHSHRNILSICNKMSQRVLFLDNFNRYLGDLRALTWCCPGNRSLVSRWPCDGTSCIERCPGRLHWAERARHKERERKKQRERQIREWSLHFSCFSSIHFKSGHFVAQSWNTAARLGFPLCQTERKILWNLYGGATD